MNTLLVQTVTGRTMAELCAARDAVRAADMVELRLDGVADIDVGAALADRRRPVIVTCRPQWDGGRFDASEDERQRILTDALRRGADYVDLEWRAGCDAILRETGGARIILSFHDFTAVPEDLAERVRAMRSMGAEIVKVAVTPAKLTDALRLRELTRESRTVAIGMGDIGVPTRLLPAHFGSCWTYAGDGAAPGQIPAQRLVEEYRFRNISRSTAVFGLVGTHVAASRSPAMHNRWFAEAGLDAVFVPMPTTDFADFLAFADSLSVQGAAVTIPFKLDALRAAVRADDVTRRVGASNTLRRTSAGWEATNTDVFGFLAPFGQASAFAPRTSKDTKASPHENDDGTAGNQSPRIDFQLTGARVSVLGAGGAARAVVVALDSRGAHVTVHARRSEQAREVASLVGAAIGPWPPAPHSWDVLVNCTPLGGVSAPDLSPLPGGPFDGRLVYDLISRPPETPLLREARASGCAVINGEPMLRAQAERQFEYWTKSLCV
jgi:3-dehydroquinate dehydratase/shikimate dehydrogenase